MAEEISRFEAGDGVVFQPNTMLIGTDGRNLHDGVAALVAGVTFMSGKTIYRLKLYDMEAGAFIHEITTPSDLVCPKPQ